MQTVKHSDGIPENNTDPDEMTQFVASLLGLRFFPPSHFSSQRHSWVIRLYHIQQTSLFLQQNSDIWHDKLFLLVSVEPAGAKLSRMPPELVYRT